MRHETEAQFQARVVELARWCGWLHYHTHDSRRSAAGFPDLVLVHAQRGVLFRELKTETGIVTGAQQMWIHRLTLAGANAAVWRPRDWDEITATLKGETA